MRTSRTLSYILWTAILVVASLAFMPKAHAALTFAATDIVSDGAFTLTGEGATADAFETILTFGDATADATVTIPVDTTTTLAGLAVAQTFTAANTFTPGTNVSAITLTGTNVTTGTLLAGTASALTTGKAASWTATNTAVADTAGGITPFLISATNAQATAAQTVGSGYAGFRVNFTNNPTIAGNTENMAILQNQVTANATDNAVTAGLLIDNADTSAGGSTVLTNGLLITNSGAIAAGITNAINIGSTTVTTDLSLQNLETIDNDVNGSVVFGRNDAGIVTLTAKDDDATAALTILPGGAAAMVLGGASTTSITLTTDANATNDIIATGGVTGSTSITATTFMNADAYQVTNGTTITATGNLTKANLQAASYFAVNPAAATDISIFSDAGPDAADVGRTINFAVITTGGNLVRILAGGGITTVTLLHSVGSTGADAVGDVIRCLITSTTTATCTTITSN